MLNEQQQITTKALRYQLGALIARSEAELSSFYQIYDAYLDKHSFLQIAEPPPSEDPLERSRKRQLRWALLPLGLFLLWWLFQPKAEFVCPDPSELQLLLSTRSSGRYQQEISFEYSGIQSEAHPDLHRQLTPEQYSLHWDFGDGSTADSSKVLHRYRQAGTYYPTLRLLIGDSCEYLRQDTLLVKADVRLDAAFSFQQITPDSFHFRDNSYYFSSPDSLNPSDTTKVEYRWDFGDGEYSRLKNPVHHYQRSGDYNVSLAITAHWPDSSATDSHEQRVSNMPVPKLGYQALADENIADLLRPSTPNFLLLGLAIALLLTYATYELIRAWQRKIALEEAPLRGPPLRQPLQLDPPLLDFLQSSDFYQLSRSLRRRRADSGRLRPDLPRSIQQTAEAGGFPSIKWQQRSHAAQYLVLMQQDSKYDHLVQLFAAMAKEWEARDISVAFYTYKRDPQICQRLNSREYLSLSQLHNLYPNDRLLIVGRGEELLAEEGDALAEWAAAFEAWPQRAWLSSRSTESWGQTEQLLSQTFLLLPASQTGLGSLVQQWEAEQAQPPQWWKRNYFELSVPDLDSPDLIPQLKSYLGQSGFEWLAACAWYPELRWELSLQLGKLMENQQAEAPPQALDSLIHLLRLSYFREGSMPRKLREQLVAALPAAQSKAVRAHLLQLLQQPRNQPPADSYAAIDQQVRIALFSYLNSDKDRQAQKAIQQALKELEPEDIEDQISLSELNKIPTSPLALILPARYFRGQVPFFGLRQKYRLLLMGLPLLLFVLLSSWLSFEQSKGVDYLPDSFYHAQDLIPLTDAQRARWHTHTGYLFDQQDSLMQQPDSARHYFERALQLDSSQTKALQNLSLSYYNHALKDYEEAQFSRAIDSLQPIWTRLQLQDRRRQLSKAQLWIPYSQGLNHLRNGQTSEGISALQMAFCEPMADSSYQYQIRDSLLQQPALLQLIKLLHARPGNSGLSALLQCLGGTYTYNIRVLTASDAGASTDDPVFLQINGQLGQLRMRLDRGAGSLNRAESLGHIVRNFSDLGELRSIRLELPQAPGLDDWKVAQVRIRDVQRDRLYFFELQTWLGDRENRYAIEVQEGPIEEPPPPNDSISISYLIKVLDSLKRPFPQAEIQLDNRPPYFTDAAGLLPIQIPVSLQQLDSLRAAAGNLTVQIAMISAPGYQPELVPLIIPPSADTLRIRLSPQKIADPPTPTVPPPKMVSIKGGKFMMGNLFEGEGSNDELPVHEVTVSDFQMGAYEVSFAEYDLYCEATGYEKPNDRWGRGQQPVINVDWYEAVLYCNWLSEQHGYEQLYRIDRTRQDPNNNNSSDPKKWLIKVDWNARGYRLPTEAEWEYAAREGGEKVRFGNGRDTADAAMMNFRASTAYSYSKVGQYRGQTVEISSFAPNALGLYNMSGNVYEWCWDWYGSDYYAESGGTQNPRGPSAGSSRVLRGGSWGYGAIHCRTANRSLDFPRYRDDFVGFRLVFVP